MYDNNTVPNQTQGFRGGLVAALVVFALTWFVVNGAAVPSGEFGARDTREQPLCSVPGDIPTSRFLNAPLPAPVPWTGG